MLQLLLVGAAVFLLLCCCLVVVSCLLSNAAVFYFCGLLAVGCFGLPLLLVLEVLQLVVAFLHLSPCFLHISSDLFDFFLGLDFALYYCFVLLLFGLDVVDVFSLVRLLAL